MNLSLNQLRQLISESQTIHSKQEVDRPDLLNWLIKGTENDLIKVLTGFRRTGKSYLLKQFVRHLVDQRIAPSDNIFFVNFEHDLVASLSDVGHLRTLYEKYQAQIYQKGKIYLILDEIQNVNKWEKFVRTIYETNKENCQIYITGSNSSLLSSEFSTALSGRTIEQKVYPYSFNEYLLAHKIILQGQFNYVNNKTKIDQLVNRYLIYGGLPETVNLDVNLIPECIQGVFRKILLDDIVKRFTVQNIDLLETYFRFIASNVGGITSQSSIKSAIEHQGQTISLPTLANYLRMYGSAFAVDKVDKFEWKLKRIFNRQAKLYLVDNGLITTLNQLKLDVTSGLLENAVYQYLSRKYDQIYFGRDDKGKEIDFLVKTSSYNYLKVQVSLELNQNSKLRELNNFVLADKYLSSGDNYLVVHTGETEIITYRKIKIQIINIRDLLTEQVKI